MITNILNIKIVDSVDEAPKYPNDFIMIKATNAIVVPKGTKDGNPTVDIQFIDMMGNRFVMMITGNLIEALGKVVEQKRIQTNNKG